jgi:hypothetical protein
MLANILEQFLTAARQVLANFVASRSIFCGKKRI